MKPWPILLLFAVSAIQADEETVAAQTIAAQLRQPPAMRGTFTQVKNVEGIPGGLRSSGHYLFWRDHGIFWATEQPVKRAVTYRQDTTLVWPDGSGEPVASNKRSERHFRRMLLDIFSFDQEQLAREFETHWHAGETGGWRLELLPGKERTRRFLTRVELWGGDNIDGMRMRQVNGDLLQIEFTDSTPLETVDPSDCRDYFAYSAEQCGGRDDAAQP